MLQLITFHVRYLRASEDIKAGDVVLEEYSLNRGPIYSTRPVCLGCYQTLSNNASERHICNKCGWPLCSEVCEKSPEHAPECEIFASRNVKVDSNTFNYDDIEPMYDVICPIRVLWQREHEPQKWSIFWKLMSHVDDWSLSSDWKRSHENIVKYIIEDLKIGN